MATSLPAVLVPGGAAGQPQGGIDAAVYLSLALKLALFGTGFEAGTQYQARTLRRWLDRRTRESGSEPRRPRPGWITLP